MASIVVNGSSEFTGFSAVSYGHHLPLTADSVLFHLDDTKHIGHRRETQRVVDEALSSSFESIAAAVQSKSGHTVSVLDAVHHGQSQHSPPAEYRKHHLLGEAADYSMGQHDDDIIFIVFDWTNHLLSTPDICNLYKMANPQKHHFYFLFGQHVDESIAINCHREGGGILNYGQHFHHFDEQQFVEDTQELDMIYDLTCPATVHTPKYNGHIQLRRNVQWIDPVTITECDLHHLNGATEPDMLDPTKSIITARDFADDGNTFKVLDHLMADPVTFSHIRGKGCTQPVYTITKVMRSTERHHDPIRDEHYHILKLYVSLPTSPMEYMASSHISGDNVAINLNDAADQSSRRRLTGVEDVSWNKLSKTLKTHTFSFDDSSTKITWSQYAKHGWDIATKGMPEPLNAKGSKDLFG